VYRSLLSDQLVRKSEGVFLWAVLVVRNINEEFDHGATQDQLQYHLSKIPKDLSVLIGSIVASRASDKHCLPALLWMLSGHYHMTLGDLYHGIKLGAGNPTFPFQGSNSVDRGSMVRFIVNVSGGLIEMPDVINIDTYNEEPHNLQFIHESVRQYILIGGLASLNSRLSCDVAPNSHAILLEWCQTYIQLPLLSQTEFPIDHQTKKVAWDKLKMMGDYTDHDAVRDRVIQAFPFLEYISEYMLHHMDAAFAGNCYELDWLCDFPLQDWINVMNVMLFEGAYYVPSTSLLHFLLQHLYVESTFDTGIIKGILEKYPAKSTTLNHDEDTMEVVLKRGAEICIGNDLNDFCGGLDGTPLVAAASNRTVSDIQMLLDRGADPNICGDGAGDHQYLEGDWEAPLQAAASRAKIDVVTLLLDHGANVNHRGGYRGSALSAAVWTLHEGCRQLLLDRGADINLKDSKGRNIALHGTRYRSPNNESLRWLIAHGARAGLEQANELLNRAAEDCVAESIRLSVQLGADPHSRDAYSRTGLHVIAERDARFWTDDRRSSAIVLLDLGADVNALGGEYGTCLIAASSNGFQELVKLFLDRGAEVHHRSGTHGTALDAAEAAGHQKIRNLLRLAMK
jgi:ankyrin repeat protein